MHKLPLPGWERAGERVKSVRLAHSPLSPTPLPQGARGLGAHRLAQFVMSLLLIALLGVAHAETLPDPTRPAIGWNAAAQADLPSGPQLHAIRSQGGVRSALIDGQEVRIGSKFADAVVTRIDEDRLWLRGPGGVQELKLFPEVEKRSSVQEPKKRVAPPSKRSRKEVE